MHSNERVFFSGLNGLRAIAALAVVFAHITRDLHYFGLDVYVLGKNADGNQTGTLLAGFGVSIFFTLSGFLITYLLLEEKKAGEINIRNFYIRRILRIWPLYYLYLLLAIITAVMFDIPYDGYVVLLYVFLLANVPFIVGSMLPFLEHYWSLGVEEQFYSFWPWIVKKSKSLLRTTIILCVGLIVLKTVIRLIDIKMLNGGSSLLYYVIHVTRFHCMLIGAIGAILYFQKHKLFLALTNHLFIQVTAWIILALVAVNQFHVASFLDNELVSVVGLVLIIGQIEKRNRIINLNIAFFDFIGKISYGIYILHPLVIFYLAKVIVFTTPGTFSYVFVYASVFVTTIGLAYVSYTWFEQWFLKLKDRYTTVRSSGTMYESRQ